MTYLKAKLVNKSWLWLGLGLVALLLFAWFYGPDVAHAAPTGGGAEPAAGAKTASDEAANAAYSSFLSIVLLLQSLLNKILWPILFMIGGLMDNDLIFNHGMETRLFSIWVQIRNIVNILFVVALVGLALYNVLGIGGEGDQFSLKAVLPKLIIGIIAVNFSYVAIKIMLDAINLGTTAIFSLPEAVEQGLSVNYKDDNEKNLYQKVVCENLYGPGGLDPKSEKVQAILAKEGINASDITVESTKNPFICVGVKLNQSAEKYLQQYGARNSALVLAINMGKIAFFDKAAIEGAGSFAKLSLNVLFSLVLYFVYVFSFVALFIVLIARLIVLWLGVALSPFLMLSMALPAGIKEQLNIVEKIQFIKHAFVPLAIAFPMTIGYMMLQAFQGISFAGAEDFSTSVLTTGTLNIGVATSGLSTLQDLMIAIATVGVVWKGVFDAAEGTLADSIVQTIKGAGESLGGFIGSAPFKYIPWVPVTTGSATSNSDMLTPSAIVDTLKEVPANFEREQRQKAQETLKRLGVNTGGTVGNPRLFENIQNAEGVKNALRNNYNDLYGGRKDTGEALQKFARSTLSKDRDARADIIRDHPEARELFDKIADEKTTPEQAAKLGQELARKIGIDGQSAGDSKAADSKAASDSTNKTAVVAGIDSAVAAAGGKGKLEGAVSGLSAKAKEVAKQIDAAKDDQDIEKIAKDNPQEVAQIEAYMHSETQKAITGIDGITTSISGDEQAQVSIGHHIGTAKAQLEKTNPDAAKNVEQIALEKLQAKLDSTEGLSPTDKATIIENVKKGIHGEEATKPGDDDSH